MVGDRRPQPGIHAFALAIRKEVRMFSTRVRMMSHTNTRADS